MAVHAHWWTVVPHFVALMQGRPLGGAIRWRGRAADGVPLSGALHLGRQPGVLVVVVHGLGGDEGRPYVLRLAREVLARGASVLRLNLRGADLETHAFYHAGLTADLHAVLDSPALRDFEVVHFIGFSLGGHLTARLASEPCDPRVGRLVGLCPPLDLGVCQRHLDHPSRWLYRENLLIGLRAAYQAAAARGPMPTPWPIVRRVTRLYDWDHLTVVPHFGFGTNERYYAETAAGPRLPFVHKPLLLLGVLDDPIVPWASVEPWLQGASPWVSVRTLRTGGHGYFPIDTHLGLAEEAGIDRQIVQWLLGAP